MDAGIIRNFKGYYRRLLMRYLLQCIEDGVEQIVSIKLAITYVKEAWASVKQLTIVNCWCYVKILPPTQQPTTNTETNDADDNLPLAELQRHDADDDLRLVELQRLLQRKPAEDRMNAINYVNIDRDIETGETLTEDNILEMVSETRAADHVSDDDDDDEPEELTLKKSDARKGLAQAIGFASRIWRSLLTWTIFGRP